MNQQNIEEQIITFFEEILKLEPGSVRHEATFEDLKIDSISFIRLVVLCETQFEIQFEDEMLLITRFPDVNTYIKYIQSRFKITNKIASGDNYE